MVLWAGVDLNAQDNDGWTPLHAAAHWCQKEACAFLADNLANMDIQTPAGQTCFDVADPDIVKLLEELKKKQASMQKDRPEIQAILQRTSNRPPLKRRTSVTRMSGHEKSKSVMKDTKSERAQIENLTLPEEENEEEKEKRQNASIELFRTQPSDKAALSKPLKKPNHDIPEVRVLSYKFI
ncbi:UNVERIFIED_CONTAM: Ppp1r12a [Trichonephila clavipes]